MQKYPLIILFAMITAIIVLLIVSVYLLVSYQPAGTNDYWNNYWGNMDGMMSGGSTASPGLLPFILIALASILSVGTVFYFVYSRKTKANTIETGFTTTTDIKSLTALKDTSSATDPRPFDVFLCYKKSSGRDFADHLKTGLEESGLHTFEDCRDIPQTVDTEDGWACVRDKALEQCRYFVLIMTPGFNLSSELIKEIAMARRIGNKTFVYFRHRSMGRNIMVNLENEVLDIGKLEQVSFESKEELLRLAHGILIKTKP
ncbi:MAG: TIR domain-containing protein [Candidatus Bathyarchaeota archaeon]|nr:TIR domain-containing protein [Candidatus Bathyarchaeota archaeon]